MTITPRPPEFRHRRADMLIVDHSVQRALDTVRVDRMAADLHMDALGVITVSRRADGTGHIIDGQHRAAAVLRAGLGAELLPCMEYEGLTRAQEAAMFIRLNESKQVQSVDRFRIRVVEGDPVAVRLNAALNEQGWWLGTANGDGNFSAVAALESVYRGARITESKANLEACRTVLSLVTAAYGNARDGVRKEIISGLGLVVLRHGGQIDERKMVTEMALYPGGALGLIGKGKGLRELRGGNVGDAVAEVLTTAHNKGRRTRRLPDWTPTGTRAAIVPEIAEHTHADGAA